MFSSKGHKPTGTSIAGANDTSSVATISLDSTVMDSEFTVISYAYMSWFDDLCRHMEIDGWILKKSQVVLSTTSDSVPLKLLRYQFDN